MFNPLAFGYVFDMIIQHCLHFIPFRYIWFSTSYIIRYNFIASSVREYLLIKMQDVSVAGRPLMFTR